MTDLERCHVCGWKDVGECNRFGHIANLLGRSEAVTRDIQRPNVPHGCITPKDLRRLADSIEKLDRWHYDRKGADADRPCLRRVESGPTSMTAYLSAGPAVGGAWLTLELSPSGWRLVED